MCVCVYIFIYRYISISHDVPGAPMPPGGLHQAARCSLGSNLQAGHAILKHSEDEGRFRASCLV